MSKYELHLGDCLEVMKSIPAGSVDLVLCDLPYGTTSCKWDSVLPFDQLWFHYSRIITDRGAIVLTCAQPFTTALIASNMDMFKYCWIWVKSRKGDVFNAKNKPLRGHEEIAVFSKGTTANKSERRMTYNPQGVRQCDVTLTNIRKDRAFVNIRPSLKDTYRQTQTGYPDSVLRFDNEGGTVHPTQKPVSLMEYLIKTYTNEGDTVMDNCMGSGTTGVACMNTGRRFIGIEMDAGYFQIAQGRIVEAAAAAEK